MTKLQQRVARFARTNWLEADVAHRLLDAVAELGELAKEALKGSNYGAATFVRTKEWEDEFGDVMFSLLCVANQTGVDVEKAVARALAKYKKRIAAKGSPGSRQKGRTRR